MYHFIQENTDKRCRWRMIPANRELNLQPAFKTILSVSSDPAQIAEQGSDPDDKVKYFGPLYFDLDGKDIAKVTAEAKKLVNQLKESYFIPSNAIKIYLSGKKGFHIIVSEKLFGIPAAGKLYLPLIYKEFAMKFNLESLDEGVYSLGKGRMWRCSGVQRPDNGKYKVQITQEELNNLTEESYAETCSTARPDFAESGTIEEMPELKSFVDATFDIVKRNLKDTKREQSNLTNEDIQAIEGVPGCIELLVTEGDCADSNWNLAAMTLASYLGAKYEDRNDPEAVELVERFVVNVESGTRPSVKDRQTAMKDLLNRAYSGTIRFFAGSLFRTLGKSCGSCDLCTKKISSGEGKQANGYDANTGIRIARHATYLVGEESSKKIATFGITPEIIYTTLDEYNQEIVM